MAKEEYWLKRPVIRTNGAPLGKRNDADRLYYQHSLPPPCTGGLILGRRKYIDLAINHSYQELCQLLTI